jgi:hypothetical protein
MAVRRLAAALDSFLLKLTIEELLGWPVQLVSGGLLDGIESALNLTGAASKYAALASGEAHIYPEARQFIALCRFFAADLISVSGQTRVVGPRLGLSLPHLGLAFGRVGGIRALCAPNRQSMGSRLSCAIPHVVLWMFTQLLLIVLP